MSVLFAAAPAYADSPPKTQIDPGSTPSGVRRDPKGIQGISPLWESVARGDGLVLARDFDGAITTYRDAINANPEAALAHYRLAEARALKGDLAEAEIAYTAALRFVGKDDTLKGKVLFCLADLAERQKLYDVALERWNAYEAFAKDAGKAKVFPASAGERKKRISEWKQNLADSVAVKARIDKRLKEVDESVRKSSK